MTGLMYQLDAICLRKIVKHLMIRTFLLIVLLGNRHKKTTRDCSTNTFFVSPTVKKKVRTFSTTTDKPIGLI